MIKKNNPRACHTDLVSALLGTQPQIRDIHCLSESSLRRCIKNCIERDMLEELVHSEFVGVDYHDGEWEGEGRIIIWTDNTKRYFSVIPPCAACMQCLQPPRPRHSPYPVTSASSSWYGRHNKTHTHTHRTYHHLPKRSGG